MSKNRILAVIGVGPGIGQSVAEVFAANSYDVALVSRTQEKLDKTKEGLEKQFPNSKFSAVAADVSKPDTLISAFEKIKSDLGEVDTLVLNVGAQFHFGGIADTPLEKFKTDWEAGFLGAVCSSQQVIPDMLKKGSGSILITGATASLKGGAQLAPFASSKFALRGFSQSMARELGPQGIHVAHIIIDGLVDLPSSLERFSDRPRDSFLTAKEVALQYFQVSEQHKSVWTQELDLRPYCEKF